MDEAGRGWIGSCGMYVFRREVLVEVMEKYKRAKDFGRDLIPAMIKDGYKVSLCVCMCVCGGDNRGLLRGERVCVDGGGGPWSTR